MLYILEKVDISESEKYKNDKKNRSGGGEYVREVQ